MNGNLVKRELKQKEFAKAWIGVREGILHLCPRFGKTFVGVNILEHFNHPSTLICYPDLKIKDSWKDTFKKTQYDDSNVTYTTHRSMHKYDGQEFRLLIIDEIHLLSANQTLACRKLMKTCKMVLGLSGTITAEKRYSLRVDLGLKVVGEYTIEEAIEDGLLPDYEITILKVPLDKNNVYRKGYSEKKWFDRLSYAISNMERRNHPTKFVRLQRMRVIQNSEAKVRATKMLIDKHSDERLLVFCGLTKIADSLGIPSQHSKSREDNFRKFLDGEINHISVVKMGNTGVTYKPLSIAIVNYFDSNSEKLTQQVNRCMSFEYANPNKTAKVYIISSDESVELEWLKKALSFFDKSKIKYYE